MQLGILLVTNTPERYTNIENPLTWLQEELLPFFKTEKIVICREEIFALKNSLQSFKNVDVIIILADLGLHQLEHIVAWILSLLDTRIYPLEEAIKFAMVEKSGALAALNTPIAGLINQSYIIAIPNNPTEIKVITELVLKPFLLNHVFFDKIKIKPLEMLEEYLKSG